MTTAAIRNDWVGRVVDGRFTLLQWLGGSGCSDVFLTELQGPSSQKAAIKLIPADADAETYFAVWEETKTLSHPHLMSLLHSGRCQIDAADLVYVVTEYSDDVLSEIIPQRPLTPSEAKEMLAPVLDALSYLHRRGFVHGHLKPSNIMAVDDQVKLSADNLRVMNELGKHFPALTVYDAPERATEPISPAMDVWSLGVLMVEVLTQHPPVWDGSTNREPVVPESIPQPFAGIAQECLRFDRARRCTIGDIKNRLEDARPIPNPAGKTVKTAPAKLRVALIAAVLVLFAAIVFLELRSRQTPTSRPTVEQPPVPATAALPSQSPAPGSVPGSAPGTPTSKGPSVKGAVAERVLPDVPQRASMTIRGTVQVRIRVTVDPSGNVSNATFDSPGPSRYFAKLALQAARNWRFKPPQVDGQAVNSVWVLRFQFRETGTEVTPVEASSP